MKVCLQYIFCVLLAMASLLTSCVREVVLDAGEDPQVVVECVLSNDDVQELYLNFTKGASRDKTESLTEAVANLIDITESQIVGQFIKTGGGDLWTLRYTPVSGHDYRLEVQVPGYDLIYAEDTMPDVNIRAEWYSYFYESASVFEYYSYNYVVYFLESLPDNTYIAGMNYNAENSKYEVAEQICTDYPYADNFNLTGEVYAPAIDTVYRNGHVYYESVYPDLLGQSLRRRYVRIPKHSEFKKNWLIVSGDFIGDFYYQVGPDRRSLLDNGKVLTPLEGMGYVSFMGVSDAYDKYLQDGLYLQQLKESSNMTSIYIRDNIYTNINGGLGIFGAMKEEKMQWSNIKSADFSHNYDDK